MQKKIGIRRKERKLSLIKNLQNKMVRHRNLNLLQQRRQYEPCFKKSPWTKDLSLCWSIILSLSLIFDQSCRKKCLLKKMEDGAFLQRMFSTTIRCFMTFLKREIDKRQWFKKEKNRITALNNCRRKTRLNQECNKGLSNLQRKRKSLKKLTKF